MIDLLLDGVRCIFALIDKMVAFVIEYLYQLIIAIADTNVFGDLIYQYFGRIYTFLGIFMVFKLSISIINYIINPDALTDKGKGFGKLISNVVISLILLVATPTLFDVAFDIQGDILKTNVVYQVVTGKKAATGDDLYDSSEKFAEQLSFSVFSSFSYRDEGDSPYCDEDAKGIDCNTEEGDDRYVCDYGDTDCLLDGDTVTDDDNVYWFLLSTAVGCVVVYILLTICFDIALRSVKIGFLQIIAPIPIMLRMDPGAKDDKFSKWLKEVGGTFLSLFIKLAALFFVIEIIRLVMNSAEREALGMFETYSGSPQSGLLLIFARLFIIIGCLMFAKKLPQLISDLFGIKLDGGGFSLKKKVASTVGLGAALGVGALGAKKAIAGFDSMAHGKGFWNGTKNIQGNGWLSKMQKGWNEITPNRAEHAKQAKAARENISQRNQELEKGKKIWIEAGGKDSNLKFSEPYRKSYDDVVIKKKAMYAANNEVESARANLAAAQQTNDAHLIDLAEARMSKASAEAGKAQKIYDLANAKHEDMKKIYTKDAEIEKAFDLYSKTGAPSSSSSSGNGNR